MPRSLTFARPAISWLRPGRRLWLLVWLGSIAITVVASLMPQGDYFGPQDNTDKIQHFFWYAWLAMLPTLSFGPRTRALSRAAMVLALGGLLELAQGLTSWRSCSWQDFLADSLGVLSGLAIGLCLSRREELAPPPQHD